MITRSQDKVYNYYQYQVHSNFICSFISFILYSLGKLPSPVVRDGQYTLRFNVSQMLNVAVSRRAVIPE